MDLTLVILAAGMGSRFGGSKQIESVGPTGELLIDYSIYDAMKAGFNKIVFVIKEEMEETFREKIVSRVEKHIRCVCAYQKIDDFPGDIVIPKERVKPLGTGHAVYAARHETRTPFLVINADDFYGSEAFKITAEYLRSTYNESYRYCMAAYKLSNTLSDKGSVSRAVCQVDSMNNLVKMTERTKITEENGIISYEENGAQHIIPRDSLVSINCFGFKPDFFDEIEKAFVKTFENLSEEELMTKELHLPAVASGFMESGIGEIALLKCSEQWLGFTYKEDKEKVVEKIAEKIKTGIYPERLW